MAIAGYIAGIIIVLLLSACLLLWKWCLMDIENKKEAGDTNNKLNRAEKLIKKRFNETISRFETEIKSDRPVDHLCVTSLTVSVKYCEAIIILLY